MRVYKVECLGEKAVYVATQADAVKARAHFWNTGHKRAEVTTTQVDLPTKKDDLLAFINAL